MDKFTHSKKLNSYGLPANSSISDILTKHCVVDDYNVGIAVSPCGKVCDYGQYTEMPDKLKAQWKFCAELEGVSDGQKE
ncbi:MAG: hypothetical protein Unbinned6437contig1000_43 [Prokaryotic dsDNA virus sp.]|nr:MAG: hypothetical protein Unbinned6437contig1000_43 [Prokaryotic dsDNA virus sp.]|tara:strand:+ start:18211 stop:18447 length:237 start_codon:yes stop_codon:yes gene_type:complete